MNYLEISISVHESGFTEILQAELSELPFESFQLQKNQLHGYIQEEQFNEQRLTEITSAYQDELDSI